MNGSPPVKKMCSKPSATASSTSRRAFASPIARRGALGLDFATQYAQRRLQS
jgi:hypothetical protein